jgi:tetratricopeptide (TPR) repeat protein
VFSESPTSGDHRGDFFDQLVEAVAAFPGLRLIFGLRSEAVPGLEPYLARAAPLAAARFELPLLSPDDALRAVVAPVAGTGRSFAPGTAEELVRDIRTEPGSGLFRDGAPTLAAQVEPVLLQVACQALWAALPADLADVGDDELRRYGDVDGALGAFLETALAEVAEEHGADERRLRSWLDRAPGAGPTAEPPLRVPTEELPASVVRALVDRHVLRARWNADGPALTLPSRRLVLPLRERPGWGRPARRPERRDATAILASAGNALVEGDLSRARAQAQQVRSEVDAVDARTVGKAESLLGDVSFLSGEPEQAGVHYRQAAELFDAVADRTAVGWLLAADGRVLLQRGMYANAAVVLDAAVQRLPGEAAVKIELARALRLAGNLRAAAAWLGSVLTVAPDAVEALAGRGEIHAALRDYTYALEDLNNALRLKPVIGRRPTVRNARALALAGLGRADVGVNGGR